MSAHAPEIEAELIDAAGEFWNDPLAFVRFAFDGVEPHQWQQDVMRDIKEALEIGNASRFEAIQEAVASGHGIGKSALVSWLILWAMATEVDTKGVVTANTETQLKTKTWAELAKWYSLCLYKHWFTMTATALFSSDAAHEKTWRVDMVPWSERNTEAFAGLHNKGKRILLIFDEASAIPDKIWEVSEGALTDEDTQILWVAFGNPTRNTGRFRECFGRLKHRWKTRQIDSRDVPGTNKAKLQEWVDDYGLDSDFVRVRVRGVFPSAGSNQFISGDDVASCREYVAEGYEHMPKIMSVDVARFGDDQSVIGVRQGRKVHPFKAYRGLDLMQLSARVIEAHEEHKPDVLVVDSVGVGAGVVDRLRQLGFKVIEFNGGERANDPVKWRNKRAEVWGLMRDSIKAGVDLPQDNELDAQLTSVEYAFTPTQQLLLEKKEDMKARGLDSPDKADCLSMTYAVQPAAKDAPNRIKPAQYHGGLGWMG